MYVFYYTHFTTKGQAMHFSFTALGENPALQPKNGPTEALAA